jgi:hypothetical protein
MAIPNLTATVSQDKKLSILDLNELALDLRKWALNDPALGGTLRSQPRVKRSRTLGKSKKQAHEPRRGRTQAWRFALHKNVLDSIMYFST